VRGTGATHAPPFAAWPLGDVDGDGLDDLAFTAARVTGSGGSVTVPSRIYVIYGRTDTSAIDLGQLVTGRNGFAITSSDVSQFDEVAHGDVDGDGLDDLVYGASELDDGKGRVTVHYGQDTRGKLTQVGGDASDVLTGTSGTDHMTGGLDDDRLEGNGGVDVLYGGGGDDVLAVVGTDFRRVDGGIGFDTLELSGVSTLDLTDVRGHVRKIEALSLTGSTEVTLSAVDVLRASDESNELVILGGAGVRLVGLQDAWTSAGTGAIGGVAARAYRSGNATLLVQDGVDTAFPPVLATTSLSVDELSGAGWQVGTIDATDADGAVVSVDVDLGEHADALAYDVATHRLTVLDGSKLDHETEPSLTLTATVTDDDGFTASGTVTITVDDVPEPPSFPVDASYASVQEGAADGTTVAVTAATDPDVGDELLYTLTAGNDDGAFAIDGATGEITVADGTFLDFETEPVRTLTVRAEDLAGLAATRTLDVEVGDAASIAATFTVPFLTEDQSLAKSGSPAFGDEIVIDASPALTWGETTAEGDSVIEWPAIGTIDWVLSSSGTLKADVTGTITPGKLSAYLPVEVTHVFPDQIPLGTPFTVDSSWSLQDDAVVWGTTFGADLTFDAELDDYSIAFDFGSLGAFSKGPTTFDIPPKFLDVEAATFGGYKLDVLFPDGLDVPDGYDDDVRSWVATQRSSTATLMDAWSGMSPGDASDWASLIAAGGRESLTPFQSFSGIALASPTQSYLYALLDLHGVDLGYADGYRNENLLIASTGTQQVGEARVDIGSVLESLMPVAWGTNWGSTTFDFDAGYVKSYYNRAIRSTADLDVSVSQLFFLQVNGVTADVTFEGGTTLTDVDVSAPFTATLPADEDVDGDGRVSMTITYDLDVDVRKLELILYDLGWSSDVLEVSVEAWQYDLDSSGNKTGKHLYKRLGYGPLVEGWGYDVPFGQADWTTWQLGGLSRPQLTGAIQVTR
jgi:hypothetical protein